MESAENTQDKQPPKRKRTPQEAHRHEPTPEARAKVQIWAKNGVPQVQIGLLLGLAAATVVKHYSLELAKGAAEGIALLCETAMGTAVGRPGEQKVVDTDGNVTIEETREELLPDKIMQIFLLKTRAGYRDVTVTETRDASKELEFGTAGLSESERTTRIAALFDRARARGARRSIGSTGRMGTNPGTAGTGVRKSG